MIDMMGCCLDAAARQKPLRVIADVVICIVQTVPRRKASLKILSLPVNLIFIRTYCTAFQKQKSTGARQCGLC